MENRTEDIIPFEKVDLDKLDKNSDLIRTITLNELDRTSKSFKDKTPGETKIGIRVLLNLNNDMKIKYIKILNASLALLVFPR